MKLSHKILLVMFVLVGSLDANATRLEVLGGGWSVHHDGGDYNEQHGVVGLCLEHWCAASYTNSHSERSVLGYYYHPFLEGEWWSLSGKVGIMGGYESHIDERYEVNGFRPMVGLGVGVKALTIDSRDIWLDTTVTPMVTMFNVRITL